MVGRSFHGERILLRNGGSLRGGHSHLPAPPGERALGYRQDLHDLSVGPSETSKGPAQLGPLPSTQLVPGVYLVRQVRGQHSSHGVNVSGGCDTLRLGIGRRTRGRESSGAGH